MILCVGVGVFVDVGIGVLLGNGLNVLVGVGVGVGVGKILVDVGVGVDDGCIGVAVGKQLVPTVEQRYKSFGLLQSTPQLYCPKIPSIGLLIIISVPSRRHIFNIPLIGILYVPISPS